jgi:hypothetical protein
MDTVAERRQEARVILVELARSIDRRLAIEVRETAGQERVIVKLTHGRHTTQTEVGVDAVLDTREDAVARNDLRLRLKRAADTMLFRPMPDHRLSVKPIPVPPPGGQGARSGQGGMRGGQGARGRR